MPLTMRDLAPLLTPYQAPQSLDLSGVAQTITHNQDRAQAKQLADQQLAHEKAQLAEQKRQFDAEQVAAASAAAAAAAEKQKNAEIGMLGELTKTADPNLERIARGQMERLGMRTKEVEQPGVGFAPGLEMPGMPMFAKTQPLDKPVVPAATGSNEDVINRLDPRADGKALPTQPTPQRAPIGTLLGSVTGAQEEDFQNFIASTTAPEKGAADDASPLEYAPDETYVTGADGTPLAKFNPAQARDRARKSVTLALESFARKSPEISQGLAERTYSMVDEALMANGYDPQKTLDFLVAKTFTPEMQQVYSTQRSSMSATATGERFGQSQEMAKERSYQSAKRAFMNTKKFPDKNKALDYVSQIEALASSDNALSQRVGVAKLLHLLTGAAMNQEESDWVKQGAGFWESMTTKANALAGGGEVSPALLKNLRGTMKSIKASLLREKAKIAKEFESEVGRTPVYSEWKSRAFKDVYGYTGTEAATPEEAATDGGGSSSASAVTSSSGTGFNPYEDPDKYEVVE